MKIEKLEKNQQIKSREAEVCRFPKAGGGRRKERAGRAGRMYSWDGVAIMGVSIAGTLFCELISWILIYRKSSYKSLVASITRWVGEDAEREPNRRTTTGPDPPTALSLSLSLSPSSPRSLAGVPSKRRTGKTLEAMKAENAGLPTKSKSLKKKEERLEKLLKENSFELQKSKMTATVFVSPTPPPPTRTPPDSTQTRLASDALTPCCAPSHLPPPPSPRWLCSSCTLSPAGTSAARSLRSSHSRRRGSSRAPRRGASTRETSPTAR